MSNCLTFKLCRYVYMKVQVDVVTIRIENLQNFLAKFIGNRSIFARCVKSARRMENRSDGFNVTSTFL